MAISGAACAVNIQPPTNNINPEYQAANGLITIAGGGKASAFATDSNNGQNDDYNHDYGIAIGAAAKGFWASVAMGDTAEARSLYGTAIGPKATIDDDSNYAVSMGNQASIKTSNNAVALGNQASIENSNNGVVMGSNATLSGAANSVAIGSAAAINNAQNAVALGANSVATADNTVSIGSKGSERKLVNLKEGEIAANSTEAVTGSQLYAVNQTVGTFDARIISNANNINSLNNGKSGMVQILKNPDILALGGAALNTRTFDIGGNTNNGDGVTQGRTLTGVAKGEISATSLDAINGSQISGLNTSITNNSEDIQKLNSGEAGLVQLNKDRIFISAEAKDAMIFDLTATDSAGNIIGSRTLTGISTGDISENSLDAINGSQLYATNVNVSNNSTNINNLKEVVNDINIGKSGLIQLTEDGRSLAFSQAADSATTFNVNRTLSGVTDGTIAADSTEAVNGSQLFKTGQDISDLAQGKIGLVQLDSSGQNLIFGSAAASALVFNVGDRTISGVRAGRLSADSTEAVNGSQLHETNLRVEQNAEDIKSLAGNTGGSNKGGMLEMSDDGQSLVVSDAGKGASSLNLDGRTITGVADGELSASSTEAVNGSQLFATNEQVAKNTSDISNLSNDITSGKAGVVQIDGDKIVFNDAGKGTTTLDVGDRNIANIKEGELSKNSKDAVNGSQLFETNTRVEQNTADIVTNRTDINKNRTDIAHHSTQIADLENAFSGMNQSFRNLSKEVNKNKKRANAGIAGAMAMTAIPQISTDDFSFGMAMSGYRDQGALASGLTFKVAEHAAMKINTSWDSQNGTGVAAGFAWGW